jgi:hypothetical protein
MNRPPRSTGPVLFLLLAHSWAVAQGVPDERSFFDGICTAIKAHALPDAHIERCMVVYNEVGQSVSLNGDSVGAHDLEDLCVSIGGTPDPSGNLPMSVYNTAGAAFSRPCQLALPYRRPMRRVDVN